MAAHIVGPTCSFVVRRHTWRQRARRVKVGGYALRAILGHEKGEDIHDIIYDDVPGVKELARAVEAVARDVVLKTKLRKSRIETKDG